MVYFWLPNGSPGNPGNPGYKIYMKKVDNEHLNNNDKNKLS